MQQYKVNRSSERERMGAGKHQQRKLSGLLILPFSPTVVGNTNFSAALAPKPVNYNDSPGMF